MSSVPLSTLLSQALVAFTIEFDNEWEWRFVGGKKPKMTRTSMVMWSNFMRFADTDKVTVREISSRAGYPEGKLHPSLHGMTRWGYVTVDSKAQKSGEKSFKLDWLVSATTEGLRAANVWKPLAKEIELRWENRFGNIEMAKLRNALKTVIKQFEIKLPHYFPVLNSRNGMFVDTPHKPDSNTPDELELPFLLSQVLHGYTLDFEKGNSLSLAYRANMLRALNENGVRKRELPRLSGTSKEAMAMAAGFLEKTGHVEIIPDPDAPRGKLVSLTRKGWEAQKDYHPLLNACEKLWAKKFGAQTLEDVRSALEPLAVSKDGEPPSLFKGLDPPDPSVWRAQIPKPQLLPHHPMVLPRGGWPDGS